MGLSIRTTGMQLGINRTPGKLEIETKNAVLSFHGRQTKVNISNELPMVIIDQYECFATAGLKNNYDLTKNAAQEAYQQMLEFIAKTASDGYALAAIENGGNPLKSIVIRDAYPEHEFGIDFIPKARPKIDFTGGTTIDWDVNNGVEGYYDRGFVNISYVPASISVYVKQYAAIDIEYQGNIVDSRV